MSDELDVLLDKIDDPALRADIADHVRRLRSRRAFGLVFENHLPESVRLPGHKVRRGVLAVRRDYPDDDARTVLRVADGKAELDSATGTTETVAVEDLVVVAEFGQPVYPGLHHIGGVHRGGDKAAHVVIKGENHHALEMLRFTHAGKVDCIYIDPPYNTGARDWKYNNDFVDADDAYRHSKWLAFMERRLLLAKELLNPENSVLVVSIDEKEVHRLALLLEQTFPGARIQGVSVTISPRGTSRANEFSRVDETVFFVWLGDVQLVPRSTGEDVEVRWQYLRRDERTSARASGRPNQFYPIYVNEETNRIEAVGDPLEVPQDRQSVPARQGCVPVFPVKGDGTEMVWGLTPESLREIVTQGFVRVTPGVHEHQAYTLSYVRAVQRHLKSGNYRIVGEREDGTKIVVASGGSVSRPTTVWREKAHDAGAHGTGLLGDLLPNRHFPFPKSLYAVEDTLRFFVADKPNAVVLDFFSGSGTTAHALIRLNKQDGGRRQSISVTNNEVSADEQRTLRKEGRRPGDPEWEALGIFEHVTRPRIEAALTGLTPDGEPVKGDYKFTDEFPMSEGFDESVEFFELTYLDAEEVELDMAFEGIAPLLWLRAGATGPIVTESLDSAGRRKPYSTTDQYGVLFNPDCWRGFIERLPKTAKAAFVVTDSVSDFAGIASDLPTGMDVVRLYENYLSTFAINERR